MTELDDEPGVLDWQAMIRDVIGSNLAAPIEGFPDVDATRRRLLELNDIPMDADGWVAGVRRPTHQGRTGCRFEYGTWIHYGPEHDCPDYVRGCR